MTKFLNICEKKGQRVLFVFFDDCWNAEGYLGKQPPPIPGVHNSRWVQSPGENEYSNTTLFPIYQQYVTDIITTYKDDKRVLMWDIYNEPGNSGHLWTSKNLLANTFKWARDANPS